VAKVVIDTSVLINFCHLERLDLLGSLESFEFMVPSEVEAEIEVIAQRTLVEKAIESRTIQRAPTGDLRVLQRLSHYRSSNLDLGESACLALAEVNGWMVACDERRHFLTLATDALGHGRVVDTPGLILHCFRVGLVTVAQADRAKKKLERHHFKMRFASFEDLEM